MRKILLVSILIVLSAAVARADDLDDNAAICAKHRSTAVRTGPASQWKLWEDGWEHCQPIYAQKIRRDDAARASDETKNPDLKKTRDFSKVLPAQQ